MTEFRKIYKPIVTSPEQIFKILSKNIKSPWNLEISHYVCFLSVITERFFTGQQLSEIACNDETRPAYITHQNTSLLETINYPLEHPAGTHCEWVITPDNAPEVYQIMSIIYAYFTVYFTSIYVYIFVVNLFGKFIILVVLGLVFECDLLLCLQLSLHIFRRR